MEALYKVKERGLARYIGITSHSDPETLAEALTRYDVDCTQMALNAALQGMKSGPGKMVINPVMSTSFENVALPVAKKKNLGIIAMKAFGQDDIIGEDATPEKLLRYSLSLPASIVTMGVPKHEHLLQNLATARNFTPMPPRRNEGVLAPNGRPIQDGARPKVRRSYRRLARTSHRLTGQAHDRPATTSLRLLAVLNVLSEYASARQAARASY